MARPELLQLLRSGTPAAERFLILRSLPMPGCCPIASWTMCSLWR